ncbi:MAG: septum formation initiator family protein [Eubacteriales bacterium]
MAKKYNFSRFENKTPVRMETEVPSGGAVRLGRSGFRISLSNVVLYFLICITLVTILISYMHLTEVSAEAKQYTTELQDLQNTGSTLESRLEQMTSLKVVEDFAKNQLGMVQVQQQQLEYMNHDNQDKVEIIRNQNVLTSLYMAISKTFNTVLEYIR